MTTSGGQWIRVRFADGGQRLDWIPDEQPGSPDGTVGMWHVVPDPAGGESRWEWHPRLAAAAVAPGGIAPAPVPTTSFAPPPAPDTFDSPTSVFAPIAPAAMAPAAMALPAMALGAMPAHVMAHPVMAPEPPAHSTQELPLQVVANRGGGNAPSVFGAPKKEKGRSRPAQAAKPMKLRMAAWSLSVVLAVPVAYLLARHSDDNDALGTGSQSELNPNSDAAGSDNPGADDPASNPDTITGTPSTPNPGTLDTGDGSTVESGNQRFLTHLYNLDATQGYAFASLGEAYLVTAGNEACTSLDSGTSYDTVRQSVMYKIPNGGQIVVAAAATYLCPRNHPKLQAFTAQQQAAATPQPGAPTGTTTSPDFAAG